MARRIAALLITRGETLAVAECSSGGLIAHLLTNVPGCSRWFRGGVVPYDSAAKRTLVGVSEETLAREGAVSAATALALAEGARRAFSSTWGLGETGLAGPQRGRQSAKPAGESFVAIAGGAEVTSVAVARHVRGVDRGRQANKRAFALAALELLADTLSARE